MPLTSDEIALRAALQDVTVGQPELPVDRIAGVRRRHTHRRRLQATAAGIAVAVVAVAAVAVSGVTGGSTRPAPAGQPKPAGWQLPWPTRIVDDQSGEALPTLLTDASQQARAAAARTEAEALASYARTGGDSLRNPRLLFAGRLENTRTTWVVLEASSGRARVPQLYGFASTDAGATWAAYVQAAPRPTTLEIGFASPVRSPRQVFVLAAPRAHSTGLLDLSGPDPSESPRDTFLVNGVATMSVAHPMTPGTAFVAADREYANGYPVLFDEATRQPKHFPAWQQPPTSLGAGYQVASFIAGAGGGDTASFRAPRTGTLTVGVTCAGPAPVTVVVTADGRTVTVVQRRCDGSPGGGPGDGVEVTRGERVEMRPTADDATAFSAVAVIHR